MALPETDVARVRRWVEAKNDEMSPDVAAKVRIEVDIDPRSLTVVECWAPGDSPSPADWIRQEIARLRYLSSRGTWVLYWPDSNSAFHRYDELEPTPTVERLLAEIDDDPTCIFWG